MSNGLFTFGSNVNQAALAGLNLQVPREQITAELEVAKLVICHLVHAQGGSFVISDDEFSRDIRRFQLQIEHRIDPGMMVIKVREKE